MNEEKYKKTLKNIFQVSIAFLIIGIATIIYYSTYNVLTIIQLMGVIIDLLLILLTAIGAKKESLFGPICGIITSIMMILSLRIIFMAIGIFYLVDNIIALKQMKQRSIQ